MRSFFTCILYYKMNKDGFWGKASHLAQKCVHFTLTQCRHRAMWLRLTFTQMMQNHPVFGRLFSWWRRQMEAFSVLLALCAGNSSVTGEFPSQRPVSGALVFSLTCTWANGWVNNRDASAFIRHRTHYDVTVMNIFYMPSILVRMPKALSHGLSFA